MVGFFKGESFHKFHELMAIHENFTLKIFTWNFIAKTTITPLKHYSILSAHPVTLIEKNGAV